MQRLTRAFRQLAVAGTVSLRSAAADVPSRAGWSAASAGPSSTQSWAEVTAAQSWAGHGRRSLHSSAVSAALQPPPRGNEPPPNPWTQGTKVPGFGSAGGGASPFTPTKDLIKRKTLFKRAAFIVQTLEHERMAELAKKNPFPAFRPGDVVEVEMVVPENRRRPSSFRGICIARRNRGLGSSFTLRNVYEDIAIERSFPLYSPHLKSLKIIERRKVRRAKLYYLRKKPLKFSRVGGL